jgi:hypothetical protein
MSLLFKTQTEQHPTVSVYARLRNWHDRMLAFNRGRAFPMVAFPMPNDPYAWDAVWYDKGKLVPGAGDTPSGVPETFRNFTGAVEGLVDYLDGSFIAFTYYTAEGSTPSNSYSEVLVRLAEAGFTTAPMFETPANGWVGINQLFASLEVKWKDPAFCSGWIIMPEQPRLVEGAVRANVRPMVYFETPRHTEDLRDVIMTEPVLKDMVAEESVPTTQLTFLLSGRFDRPKEDWAKVITAAGHNVLKEYQPEVDVVVVPNTGSRTLYTNQAREAGKKILVVTELEQYLANL